MKEEQVTVKVVEDAKETSPQEKEAAVLDAAVKDGDVNPEYGLQKDGVYKVNLDKPPKQKEDAVQEQSTNEVSVRDGSETSKEVQEENKEESKEVTGENKQEENNKSNEEEQGQEIESPIELVTDEKDSTDETRVDTSAEDADTTEEQKEVLQETEAQEQIEYPENIQDLVKFMNETGGTLEDYVALNKDYDQFEDMALLREYYQKTKPHLSIDEIDFLIEDDFSYDKEIDEPNLVKRKEVAFKEAVAQAKKDLEGQKATYYKEIKAGARLTPEQQKAMDFFNRYNKESAEQQKITQSQREVFDNKTKSFFNDQFKGFEYKVGEKRYRFNVKNVNEVKNTQSDINNFVKRFLNEKNEMNDAAGYHKSLFTAMNADAIANHFYEQGKADAIKESVKSAKNIKMDPRSSHQEIEAGGIKAKVISGDNLSGLKLKLKNY